jgi:hypothetical protein
MSADIYLTIDIGTGSVRAALEEFLRRASALEALHLALPPPASAAASTPATRIAVPAPTKASLGAVQAPRNGDQRQAGRRGGEVRERRLSSANGDGALSWPRSTPPASAEKSADLRPVKTFL